MKNSDKYIITQLLHTLYWSNKAKSVDSCYARWALYRHKDECLHKAVECLRRTASSRIQWRKVFQPDQNGVESLIFYFEFKIKRKKYQISFHNFDLKFFGKNPEGNSNIEWNGLTGQSHHLFYSIKRNINK